MRAPHLMSWLASLCFAAGCCAATAQSLPVITPSQVLPYPTDVVPPASGGKYAFGCGFAVDGNRMLVTAAETQAYPPTPASLFFYAKNSSGKWYYAKRIAPRSGGAFRCALALKGDTAVIAGEEAGVGVVYVFRNTSGTTWTLTQVIPKLALNLAVGPDFLAIGNSSHAADRGIVYFYKLISPAKYSLLQTVRGADYGLNFGLIDGSGPNTLVVAQSTQDGDDEKEFVYEKAGDVWSLKETFSYGWRTLGSAAYQPGYLAIENTVYQFAEIYHQVNGAWTRTQIIPGECDSAQYSGFLAGPLALGGNRLVFRDNDTNNICMAELHNGTFKDTAILKSQFDGYWPTISGNTIFLSYPYNGGQSNIFTGAIEAFALPAVVN
jgi:hypothetical protein